VDAILGAAVLWPVLLVASALLLVRVMRRADRADQRDRRAGLPVRVEPALRPSVVDDPPSSSAARPGSTDPGR
jgi:hypothetical protein